MINALQTTVDMLCKTSIASMWLSMYVDRYEAQRGFLVEMPKGSKLRKSNANVGNQTEYAPHNANILI